MPLIVNEKDALILEGDCVRRVKLFEEVREDVLRCLSRRQAEKAEQLVLVSSQANTAMYQWSKELQSIFGTSYAQATKTTQRLYELARIGRYDLEELRRTRSEIDATVFGVMEQEREAVWASRVGDWLVKPELLLGEMLGWRGIMQSSEAELIEWRENAIEDTLEALYQYGEAKLMIATCKSGKVEMIPVGDECRSCEESQAWLVGETARRAGLMRRSGVDLPRFFSRGRT